MLKPDKTNHKNLMDNFNDLYSMKDSNKLTEKEFLCGFEALNNIFLKRMSYEHDISIKTLFVETAKNKLFKDFINSKNLAEEYKTFYAKSCKALLMQQYEYLNSVIEYCSYLIREGESLSNEQIQDFNFARTILLSIQSETIKKLFSDNEFLNLPLHEQLTVFSEINNDFKILSLEYKAIALNSIKDFISTFPYQEYIQIQNENSKKLIDKYKK